MGVKANILADINDEGSVPMAEYQAAFSPEAIRAEKGTAEEMKSEQGNG